MNTIFRMNSKPLFSVGHIFPPGVMAQGRRTDKEMIVTKISCLKVKKGEKAVSKWRVDLAEHPDLREDVVIEPMCDEERDVWEYGSTRMKLKQCDVNMDLYFELQHDYSQDEVEKAVFRRLYWFYDSMTKMLKLQLVLEETE